MISSLLFADLNNRNNKSECKTPCRIFFPQLECKWKEACVLITRVKGYLQGHDEDHGTKFQLLPA